MFGLAINIRNSISHCNKQKRITGEYWIGTKPSYANEVKKTTTEGNRFKLYLQIMGLYTRLEISRLIESIPSNLFHRLFGFRDRPSPSFSLADCLAKPTRDCTGLYHVTYTWTQYSKFDLFSSNIHRTLLLYGYMQLSKARPCRCKCC